MERSLAADIQDKATLQQMRGPELAALGKTFRSRVEQQYGGQLWRVTEAGYLAGVRALAAALRHRFRLPLVQEDGGVGSDESDEDAVIVALALLLGLAIGRLRDLLSAANASVRDLEIVDSALTRAVAYAAGVQAETVASAAVEAANEVVGGGGSGGGRPAAGDEDLALGLGIGVDDLLALGSQFQRDGVRLGVQYLATIDVDTCSDCKEFSEGGQEFDGTYWEPLDPPLPGSGRCDGRCRCLLSAVYETGWAAA